jgi:hypothetical protein
MVLNIVHLQVDSNKMVSDFNLESP